MYALIHQHVLGHHPYTNIDGADPDIVTAAQVGVWVGGVCVGYKIEVFVHPFQDMPDIRRIKWNQIWLPRYFYQHIYVPMLYCAVSSLT